MSALEIVVPASPGFYVVWTSLPYTPTFGDPRYALDREAVVAWAIHDDPSVRPVPVTPSGRPRSGRDATWAVSDPAGGVHTTDCGYVGTLDEWLGDMAAAAA